MFKYYFECINSNFAEVNRFLAKIFFDLFFLYFFKICPDGFGPRLEGLLPEEAEDAPHQQGDCNQSSQVGPGD